MSNERLTSWKAIASVFDRDVRTVQRWEKEEGLPVHRHLHHSRNSVWANREELDVWWRQRESKLAITEDASPPPAQRQLLLFAAASATVLGAMAATFIAAGRAAATHTEAAVTMLGSVREAANVEVRSLRDVNGDGADDFVVHAAPSGEILLYFGPRNFVGIPDVHIIVTGQSHIQPAPVGDIDGDGLRDLAVSVMHAEPDTYHGTGPTFLVRGRSNWPARLELPRDANSTLSLDPGPDTRLVACSAADGVDLNRDGLADLVIGGADYSPPDRRSAGAAFVLFGRPEWPAQISVVNAADVTVHGSSPGHALGASCAAGDFNADGLTDLVLVATESTLWGLRGRRGSAYVFAGRSSWAPLLDAERDALVRLSGEYPSNWAQPRLADVNGDGADDLVSATVDVGRSGNGKVAIVLGSKQRRGHITERTADVLIEGGGRFGFALATADVDRDMLADLLVSEPDNGLLHLIAGQRDWKPRSPAGAGHRVIFSSTKASLRGQPFGVGDFDGDSVLDVALQVGARNFGVFQPALPLAVDVRPKASPNVLVPGGMVAIAVRLKGSPQEEIDVSSLRVGGMAPVHLAGKNDDGGVQIYFNVDTLRLPPNATRLAVVGRTHRGVPVAGSDSIAMPNSVITSVP